MNVEDSPLFFSKGGTKVERKEFNFENSYVKIINPDKEQEKEIVRILRECEGDGVKSAHNVLKMLCVPKDDRYDFTKYSTEEFKSMVEEAHMYDGFQDIINIAALISNDATIHELQYISLSLKKQRTELLMSIITKESEGLGLLAKEMYYEEKELKHIRRLADAYKEKREIQKEIELGLDEE